MTGIYILIFINVSYCFLIGNSTNECKCNLNRFDVKVSNCEKKLCVSIDDKLLFNNHIYIVLRKQLLPISNVCNMLLTNVSNADNTGLTNYIKFMLELCKTLNQLFLPILFPNY